MFNTVGDGNTPHIGEGYYHVPSSKQKSKDTPDYQPPPDKRPNMVATLSILTHEETENKCPSISPERASHQHPLTLSQQ
jgi:hypothetical protein